MARNRSIEIYLKEGIEDDDLAFALWESLRGKRPQEFFRRLLRYGIAEALERGEIPAALLDLARGGTGAARPAPRPRAGRDALAPPGGIRSGIPSSISPPSPEVYDRPAPGGEGEPPPPAARGRPRLGRLMS